MESRVLDMEKEIINNKEEINDLRSRLYDINFDIDQTGDETVTHGYGDEIEEITAEIRKLKEANEILQGNIDKIESKLGI